MSWQIRGALPQRSVATKRADWACNSPVAASGLGSMLESTSHALAATPRASSVGCLHPPATQTSGV